eukprot:jgi/Mesen1/6622/ME000034S06075
MCLTDCPDPTTSGVWWRDNAEWRRYDAAALQAILQGLADGVSVVKLGTYTSSAYPGGASYIADLRKLNQRNVSSGEEREIKIVSVI